VGPTETLIVVVVVLAFLQYRKQQQTRTATAVAAAARQAELRSKELERLVSLGRALAISGDFTALHDVFIRYLPKFTHERSCWLLICQENCWDVFVRCCPEERSAGSLESIGERALASGDGHVRLDGVICFPMIVGVHPVGVLVVDDTSEVDAQLCRAIEAAAALAAVSIRNVNSLIDLRENGLRDPLTGCFNRAHAVETLEAELHRSQRTQSPTSMIMFDVDHFKGINDGFGHLAGDHVLAGVGRRLTEVLRASDIKCRYGGDEFLIILPDTPPAGARQLAESIRQDMARITVPAADGRAITVSVGVATQERDEVDALAVIARADAALYLAKRAGRNCVHTGEADRPPQLRLASLAS
jgi:diguanylate cyclase (GGDEF)-like protein